MATTSAENINFVMAMAATIAFAITGVLAVSERRVDFFSAVMLGVIIAIGGSLIRDVLSGRKTLLMTDEVYAVPVVVGCLVTLVTLKFYPSLTSEAMIAGTIVAFTLRAAAIHWSLRLPPWFTTQPHDK